ncbi:hypothetical protein FOZ63_031484 [Perkinsus olseni]|uniref:EF-hand domain-containing protein n=1 Tax=Perkinsus olseni TaxID=32597 RepID=A0A7J6PP22_PEROL|nr:hypothetical protein FOZ63_031484 [Perkinsus olseni]KAF4743588.1 hypothetical protein FOZ62_029426 [Perkinsus olseni]
MGNLSSTRNGDVEDLVKRFGCDFCVPDRRLHRRSARRTPGSMHWLGTVRNTGLPVISARSGGEGVDLGSEEERLSAFSERIRNSHEMLLRQKLALDAIGAVRSELESEAKGYTNGAARATGGSTAVAAGSLLPLGSPPEADTPRSLREWAADVEARFMRVDGYAPGSLGTALERLECDLDHQMEFEDACPVLRSGLGVLGQQEGQRVARMARALRLAKNTYANSAAVARLAFKKMDVDAKGFITLTDMRMLFGEGQVTGSSTPVLASSGEEFRGWGSLMEAATEPASISDVAERGEAVFPLGLLDPEEIFSFLDGHKHTGLLRQEEFVMNCTPQLTSILDLILSRRKRSRHRFRYPFA